MRFTLILCMAFMATFVCNVEAGKGGLPKKIHKLNELKSLTLAQYNRLIDEWKEQLDALERDKKIKSIKLAAKMAKLSSSPGRRSPQGGWEGSRQKETRNLNAEIHACISKYDPLSKRLYNLINQIDNALDKAWALKDAQEMAKEEAS